MYKNKKDSILEPIIKVEIFSYEDMKKFEENGSIVPIGNAHYFISNFYKSDNVTRRTKNPHGITYEQMFKTFGEPNFQDDFNEDDWWILDYYSGSLAGLNYGTKRYAVHMGRTGSMISQFFPDVKARTYDKEFSIDAKAFNDQLFLQMI